MKAQKLTITLKNVSETRRHARKIAAHIKAPSLFVLSGDLGAGKTEWVRAFIKAYLKNDKLIVTSPTYSLINSYEKGAKKVVHMDLYRVRDSGDLESTGITDVLGEKNILCAEWGEIIPTQWVENRTVYHFHFEIKSEDSRVLTSLLNAGH